MSFPFLTAALKTRAPSGIAKAVLLVLADHADKKGLVWISIATLAKESQFHRRTVFRALNLLKAANVLSWKKRYDKSGDQTSSIYSLYSLSPQGDLFDSQPPALTDTTPQCHTVTTVVSHRHPPVPHSHHGGVPQAHNPVLFKPVIDPVILSCTPCTPLKEDDEAEKQKSAGIPATREEAVLWASMENVPAAFAEEIFDELEGVEWLDWHRRPVKNFRNHIRMRWRKTQKIKSNGHHKNGNGGPDPGEYTYAWDDRQNLKT